MNSFKSLCRFAKGTPVSLDHREQDVESLFGRQTRVVVVVGPLRFVETTKDLGATLHDWSVTRRWTAGFELVTAVALFGRGAPPPNHQKRLPFRHHGTLCR